MALTNAYTTLATLKAIVGSSTPDHDPDLERYITAASRIIDTYCGRRFYADTDASAKLFVGEDPYELDLPDFYETASLAVATDDDADGTFETSWVNATDLQVEPLNPPAGWPYRRLVAIGTKTFPRSARRAQIRATAKWGWAVTPAEVEETAITVAKEFWKRKDTAFGVVGVDTVTGATVRIPASVVPLLGTLEHYRRLSVAAVGG
jgi:hypothetical protein